MIIITYRRHVRYALFLSFLATLVQAATSTSTAYWKVGTGREIITPPAGVWMTGYAARTHPAEGTAQELWVKALAFADPTGQRGVLLTLDLCGITREITAKVSAQLEKKYHLPRAAVMINVSHTHCSPWFEGSIIGLRILPSDGLAKADAYRRDLELKMVRAADYALSHLAPATLEWGEDSTSFGVNRRENPEKEIPGRRTAGTLRGPSDPRVPVLAVHDTSGALTALLVSYACHNTTLSFYQWHGDYAGCAQNELEKRHPGATVLFALGCGADINPSPRGTVELAEQHGLALADAADRALGHPMTQIQGKFSAAAEEITLTYARRPNAEQILEAEQKEQPNRQMHQAWAAAMNDQIKIHGEIPLTHAYPIQAWRLGNLAWAALGGEVVVDYALRLRTENQGPLWVFGYCNDVMAYIPSERVLAEGRYEGETSMIPYGRPGPWSAGLEEKIVTKSQELLGRTQTR
ncbi:MAG: neutral/alkaline non-lysosomal ceramidase N-terminal domain-containing protein [Opitutaceae bacterium]